MSYIEDLNRVSTEIETLESKIKEETNILEALHIQKEELETKAKEEVNKINEQKVTQLIQAKAKLQEEINLMQTKQTRLNEEIEKINTG